jgi:hypothetical protein
LLELLEGNLNKLSLIESVKKDVNEYSFFESSLVIGISYGPKDLSFSRMLLYSWIREAIQNGRKH